MGTKRKVIIEYGDDEDIHNDTQHKTLNNFKKQIASTSSKNKEESDEESLDNSSNEDINDDDDEHMQESDADSNNENISDNDDDVEKLDDDSNDENESNNDDNMDKSNNSDNQEASEADEEESDNNNDDDDTGGPTNLCWADAISKILKTNKPKGKKTLVLSKAKKLTDLNKSSTSAIKKKKREVTTARIKPNILKKDRERTLSKIATRGVVQLFNAVKKQQKGIDVKLEEAGPLDTKRDKVLKNLNKEEFLNVLMGDKGEELNSKDIKPKSRRSESNSDEPTWSVLREDFMMGSKMKDWDKELEEESEEEKEYE